MASPRAAVDRTRHVRITHDIPGRLRLRLPAHADPDRLTQALQGLDGVASCVWSPLTRGLLVLYERETSAQAILEAVRDASGAGAAVDARETPAATPTDHPTFGAAVSEAAGEMDRRVRRATRDMIGLGGVVPAALAIWAVRELMLGRTAPLAWSTALWYAHGLFRDYNTPPS